MGFLELTRSLAEYGPWVVIAAVFFISYFDDKKKDKVYKEVQMQHEKQIAIILNDATKTLCDNNKTLEDSKIAYDEMGVSLERIEQKISEIQVKVLEDNNKKIEIIKTLNTLKSMIQVLVNEKNKQP